jgi:predicted ATPase/DNA-binding SARP family transcriptional activator
MDFSMDQPWQIELFGWLRATQGDRVVSRFRSRKAEALLAYLAYFRQRSHPRPQLVELLWPECDPSAGQERLSVELTSLRRQLEPPGVPNGAVLVATRTTVQLSPAACVSDVSLFEAALQAARQDENPAERARQLAAAAELYRGELLPGCFEEWILSERQRLAEELRQALHELVGLLEEAGDTPGALKWARRAVAADPLDEESHGRLIHLLLASGQIEAARAQYEQSEHLLLRELGSGLSPEIRGLIMDLSPSKDRPPCAPAGSRGKRRRRSTVSPHLEPLPAGPAASPGNEEGARIALPMHGPGGAARPSGNLPLRFTRFFGREREIARLCEMVGDFTTETRLVTLTGPGGTGKTRLALQAAQRLRDAYPGGVWFVSLLDLTDPALIPDQMRLSLRLPQTPHGEALEQAVAFLSSQPSLMLLDNFEHLVEGGVETVQKLLEQVEHLTVLVTSRRRLGLEGEREFPVAPLPVPGVQAFRHSGVQEGVRAKDLPLNARTPERLNALVGCPSVALFVDRAQAVQPDFQVTAHNAETVAGLCRRLEGLPLAIELAAARAGVLTAQQMLARIEQRFELLVRRHRAADPRHRSLRAALDWSYQLLSPELQRFFSRLSIFRGGWIVEAVTVVCWEDQTTAVHSEVLDALEELRGGSLVQVTETAGEMRFRLLETLREYGAEQLGEKERETLSRRHAEFFLALTETAEGELTRPDQGLWLDRLEREHDNLRAALTWSVESGEMELGLRLGSALQEFWIYRGHTREGRDQLLRLLAQPGAAALTAARARGLGTAGVLTLFLGDPETARALDEEGLAIWRRLEDRAGIAKMLRQLGTMALDHGDLTTARPQVEESLALGRELDDPRQIAKSRELLAFVCHAEGDHAAARAMVEESLATWRELGDRIRILRGLEMLGRLAMWRGDLDTARATFEESLALARELDDRPGIAWAITGLGSVAGWQEDYSAARAWYEQSLPLWRELGQKQELFTDLAHLGLTLRYQGDLPSAYTLLEEALALARESNVSNFVRRSLVNLGFCAADMRRWEEAAARYGESLRMSRSGDYEYGFYDALCLIGMARLALARGRPARAARLLGAAEALRAASSAPRWPNERADFDRPVSAARAQLAEAEFAAAWAEGQGMPVEAVIAEALEEAPAG